LSLSSARVPTSRALLASAALRGSLIAETAVGPGKA
jgi:hypothetical protein